MPPHLPDPTEIGRKGKERLNKLTDKVFRRDRHRGSSQSVQSSEGAGPSQSHLDTSAPADENDHTSLTSPPPLEGTSSLSEGFVSLTPQRINAAETPPRHPALKTSKDVALKIAQVLKEALDGVPDVGILKGTLGGFLKVAEIIQKKSDAENSLKALNDSIVRLIGSVLNPLKGRNDSDLPLEVYNLLVKFKDDINRIVGQTNSLASQSSTRQFLEADDNLNIINDLKSRITSLLQESILGVQLAATLSSYSEKVRRLSEGLSIVREGFESRLARNRTENTSVEIIRLIHDWIDDDLEPNILVLHGLAGIGKSTVAQSVADSFDSAGGEARRLAARFFFTRNRADKRMNVFPSIAWQLTKRNPLYFHHLITYLDSLPRLDDATFEDQLEKMIIVPVSQLPASPTNRALVIIDALDELNEDDATAILQQLIAKVPGTRLKVLITCRLEPHLRKVLLSARDVSSEKPGVFKSRDMADHLDAQDIRNFICSELSAAEIERQFPEMGWRANKDYDALVRAAGTLFIMAATMVDFIKDKKAGDPEGRWQLVLASVNKSGQSEESPYGALDRLYIAILRASVPGSDSLTTSFFVRYQKVVGSIILLQQPLRREVLGDLVGEVPGQVTGAIQSLTSVIPEIAHCPQIYHASFADFLTNRERYEKAKQPGDYDFYVDIEANHARLAERCFDIMDSGLTDRNILHLSDDDWFKDRKDQNVTEEQISRRISPELQYACRYWAVHFSRATKRGEELMKKFESFAKGHLLFWIEALSWTDNLSDALSTLVAAQGWNVRGPIQSLLRDSQRLLVRCYEIIRNAPLHLYSSALTSIPSECALFQSYQAKAKMGVNILSKQLFRWDTGLAVLKGHEDWVISIAFSPDGSRFASASDDTTVRLWDGVTGKEVAALNGHTDSVRSVAFHPDSSRLASASHDKTVRLWDGITGKEVAVLNGHTDLVTSVAFHPDGCRLASASKDRTVRLWDGITGKEVAVLNGHTDSVISIAFSPDGSRLASASHDRTVRLWDGITGKEVAILNGHTDSVISVAFSPDGSRLASASHDTTVRLWDGIIGKEVAVLNGHTHWVRSVSFSPDGSRLASASYDRTVRLWDGVTGKEVAALNGHTDSVRSVAFHPDSSRLASASNDRTVRLWDGVTGKEVAVFNGHTDSVRSVAFHPDGSRVASASHDTTVRLWDGITGKEVAIFNGHTDSVTSITFSPDSSRLASASNDRTVRLWDGITGKEVAVLNGHTDSVISVSFSPDGSRLASASDDTTVRLWDGVTGKEVAALNGHTHWVRSVSFSPDGSRLASASHDTTVRLWDGITGKEVAVLNGHTDWVTSVAFHPDGSRLASASHDKTVRLWDGVTGKEVAVLNGHAHWVISIAFSPDGSRLASTSDDTTVRLWDGVTGKEVAVLNGHRYSVRSVAFHPDGSRLASASHDTTVRLWDGITGKEVAILNGHTDWVTSVAFSPDGSRLASASHDDTVRIWHDTTQEYSFNVTTPPLLTTALFSEILFLPKTTSSILQSVSLLSNDPPTLGPPLFWLPPWFGVHRWWLLPAGGMFVSDKDGKVLILSPIDNRS